MFGDIEYDHFPFIISSGSDFQYELNCIKNKIFPKIESKFKMTKHISLKSFDLVFKDQKKEEIQSKELKDFVLLNMDSISRHGSFCICLLGEQFENLAEIFGHSGTEEQFDPKYLDNQLKESLNIAAESGYPWIAGEMDGKEPKLLEILCLQAGLMAKIKFPLFYFRVSGGPLTDSNAVINLLDDDQDNANPRMERLKQKLIRNGSPIRFYGSSSEFEDLLEKDLVNIITLFPNKTREQDDFFVDQKCFEKDKLKYFTKHSGIEKIMDELDGFHSALCHRKKSKEESTESERIEDNIKEFFRKDYSDKLRGAYKRMSIRLSVHSPCSNEDARILILSGSRGCGKSTILANWLSKLNDKSVVTIVHYCEASSDACDRRVVLRRLINSIRLKCGFQPYEYLRNIHSLDCEASHLYQEFIGAMLLARYVGVNLLIVIDGIDHLGDPYALSSQQIKDTRWIPDLIPDNVRIILTCAPSDCTFTKLQEGREDVRVINLPSDVDLSTETIDSGIQSLSAHIGHYNQICSESILRNVIDWSLIGNPFAQKVLAHAFHTLGCSPNWEVFIEGISECYSVVELVRRVIKLWVTFLNWEVVATNEKSLKKKFSQRKDEQTEEESSVKGWIPDCMALIVLSKDGLFVETIPSLLENLGYVKEYFVSEAEVWSLFHLAQDIVLRYHNGKIGFSHFLSREIAAHTFLAIASCSSVEARSQESQDSMYTDKRCKLHILLANEFWKNRTVEEGNIEECVYHLDKASDYETLNRLLFHPRVILRLVGVELHSLSGWLGHIKSIHKFMYFWQLLTKQGYDLVRSMKAIVQEYYGLPLASGEEDISNEATQSRSSVPSQIFEAKTSSQSDFAKRLKIEYTKKEEKEVFRSFTKDQSQRYLYLLGCLAASMKQRSVAREIFSCVMTMSQEPILLAHVMWDNIKLEGFNHSDASQNSFLIYALSEFDQLTSKILEEDIDNDQIKDILYIRCLGLSRLCSLGVGSRFDLGINVTLEDIKSEAESVQSIMLKSQLMEIESDTIEITSSEDEIHIKIGLLSQAILTLETWTGPMDLHLARLWMKLGVCFSHGNYNSRLKAEACYRRAMAIWDSVRRDGDCLLDDGENCCRELLINLLLQDISHSSVSEAKHHLFTTYDRRVKTLGPDHPDTKRLAPIIKVVNSLEISRKNQIISSGISGRLSKKDVEKSLGTAANTWTSSKVPDSSYTKAVGFERPLLKSSSSNVRGSSSVSGCSLQFINKYSNNSDVFEEDIDWKDIAGSSGIQNGSRNASAFSKRSFPLTTTRSELLSCRLSTTSLRTGSTPSGDFVPRNIYSGHSSSLSYDHRRSRLSVASEPRQSKQVRFSAASRNPYLRREMTDCLQAKLSEMQISKGHHWIPRQKSFSAVFSRPYYSITDPMSQ